MPNVLIELRLVDRDTDTWTVIIPPDYEQKVAGRENILEAVKQDFSGKKKATGEEIAEMAAELKRLREEYEKKRDALKARLEAAVSGKQTIRYNERDLREMVRQLRFKRSEKTGVDYARCTERPETKNAVYVGFMDDFFTNEEE